MFYSGSPYLGDPETLPPGIQTLNQCGEYYIISHNHALFQITSWGANMTGPITYMRIDPPAAQQLRMTREVGSDDDCERDDHEEGGLALVGRRCAGAPCWPSCRPAGPAPRLRRVPDRPVRGHRKHDAARRAARPSRSGATSAPARPVTAPGGPTLVVDEGDTVADHPAQPARGETLRCCSRASRWSRT